MRSKETTITRLSSPVGKLGLWRIRMSGILYIVIALYLLIQALAPRVLDNVPGYVIAITIALPIVAGMVLVRFAVRIARKTNSSVKENSEDFGS